MPMDGSVAIPGRGTGRNPCGSTSHPRDRAWADPQHDAQEDTAYQGRPSREPCSGVLGVGGRPGPGVPPSHLRGSFWF